MNTMMRIYQELFSKSETDVQSIITEVQTVAREYSSEYTNPPLPMTDTKLDDIINEALEFDPAIELNEILRSGLVNLLVNYHDLASLKPWGPDPSKARIMVW